NTKGRGKRDGRNMVESSWYGERSSPGVLGRRGAEAARAADPGLGILATPWPRRSSAGLGKEVGRGEAAQGPAGLPRAGLDRRDDFSGARRLAFGPRSGTVRAPPWLLARETRPASPSKEIAHTLIPWKPRLEKRLIARIAGLHLGAPSKHSRARGGDPHGEQ